MSETQGSWIRSDNSKNKYSITLYSAGMKGQESWGKKIPDNLAVLPENVCMHEFIVDLGTEKICVSQQDGKKEYSLKQLVEEFPEEKDELKRLSDKLRARYINYESSDARIHCLGMPDLDAHTAFGAMFYKGEFVKGFSAGNCNEPIRDLNILRAQVNHYFKDALDFNALEKIFRMKSLPETHRRAVINFFRK